MDLANPVDLRSVDVEGKWRWEGMREGGKSRKWEMGMATFFLMGDDNISYFFLRKARKTGQQDLGCVHARGETTPTEHMVWAGDGQWVMGNGQFHY